MNKDFENLDQLFEEVKADKYADGANSSMLNRYPVRFVLFDNFQESKTFVGRLIDEMGVSGMHEIAKWIEADAPDLMLTYSDLAERISKYIRDNEGKDCIVIPFSELARFYDNEYAKEFDALVSAIKGTESSKSAFGNRQRVYIPMIGQLGKMAKFFDDTQCIIWHCKASDRETNYHLILTEDTYGVKDLSSKFSIVGNLKEWLDMWRDENARENIICTSQSINSLAHFAQPDNAFTYTICSNAYEFLTKGLLLDFGEIKYREEDKGYWEELAKSVEYKNFSFDNFFNKHFDIYDLDDADVFIKTWFENQEHFERWLLSTYYLKRYCGQDYICQVLRNMETYSNIDFVSAAALTIFSCENQRDLLEERSYIMNAASEQHITLTDSKENKLRMKLEEIVVEQGYETALQYVTSLTDAEKGLIIQWVGTGNVSLGRLEKIYPALYRYMGKSFGVSTAEKKWILDYMDAYKLAKVGNHYAESIKKYISKINENSVTFSSWYNKFKTVRTELADRKDIEVFYWIDGLGIDWIPYIKCIVEEYNNENVFLNEVIIARSQLPTTTARNKVDLIKLACDDLSKKGDLDSFAHKCTPYPKYIIEEMKIVEQAIRDIVHEHAGEKVAIVSDHGISYLSQLCQGYNLGGIESDHFGRIGYSKFCNITQDNKYIILDDNKTLCSLRHESLSSKTPTGQGAHGGCTPEEVLVPIIILSSQPNSSEYAITLLDNEISGANPKLQFRIKGATFMDVPQLMYNNVIYNLNGLEKDRYISDNINLIQGVNDVEVRIGSYSQTFSIKINLGAEEDDLFDL